MNKRNLGGKCERNIKPRPCNPRFGGIQRPKRASHCRNNRACHHQKKFAMEMGIFVSKNKQELFWKKSCAGKNEQTECGHATNNGSVKQSKPSLFLAASKCGNEDIREQIAEDGKNHRQPAERADFGYRASLLGKEADEENCDLSLKRIENCVRSEMLGQTNDLLSIFGVLWRIEIDHLGCVIAKDYILEKQCRRRDGDRHACIEKEIHQRGKNDEANDPASEIDDLNARDVGTQSGNDTQHAKRKLNEKPGQKQYDQNG